MNKKMLELELEQGFNRQKAEAAIERFIESKLGMPLDFYTSHSPGVIAFERPSWIDEDKVDFDELSSFLAKEMGIEVVSAENSYWSTDDDWDNEAVVVAFDIPALDDDYRDSPLVGIR